MPVATQRIVGSTTSGAGSGGGGGGLSAVTTTDGTTIDFSGDGTGGTPLTAEVVAASIANSYLANMVQATIKGRASGAGTGAPVDLTPAQVRTLAALVPGTDVQAFDTDLAAIAALVSAADKLAYATGVGTWALTDFTAAGRALVDDASAAAQRTTLGLVIGTDVQAHTAVGDAQSAAPASHGSMGATETFDATASSYHYGTLDANCTVTLTAGVTGVLWELVLELLQDGTGSRTVTWPASVKWTAATAPTLTTTANRRDFVTLWTRDGGTTWWGTSGPLNLV